MFVYRFEQQKHITDAPGKRCTVHFFSKFMESDVRNGQVDSPFLTAWPRYESRICVGSNPTQLPNLFLG
jgi:hypothetical protein